VCAPTNAAIDDNLDITTDGIEYCLKLIKRRTRAIQLPAAVIRNHYCACAYVDAAPGIVY
jgi:hypothetical protein